MALGFSLGLLDGCILGKEMGCAEGPAVGRLVAATNGFSEGLELGGTVG